MNSFIERIFAPDPVPEYFEAGYPGSMLLRPKQLCATGEDFTAMITGAATQYAHYRNITAPTAIISGAEDRIVWPQYHSQPLKLTIPGASLELLSGVGHMVHHSRPDVVIAAVDRVAEQADAMAREYALAL
jgi:pimeloyl-ACP methyl ester carboxylesterase